MENLEEIKSLLMKQGVEKDKINLNTTIQSLGLGPEEIDEFFGDFVKTFYIDGQEYNYYDYFFEMVHPLHMLCDLFYRIFYPSKNKKIMITMAHLLAVIEKGKWFKPQKDQ
ncbi:DUF1493 family protein [Leadbetterella sp. DM7]|uniref:DUF1493 family protein n=1 Tax=Leadbetterella sp. DM7 TaxID=3235085 RepID=UPI00349ED037